MKDMVKVRAPGRGRNYEAPDAKYGRSQMDLSHSHKTTFNAGDLVPILCQEVVPGDTFTCKATLFGRIWAALKTPVMDDIEWSLDFFYTPNRILWDNWHAFLGEHDAAGAQDTDYTVPVLASHTVAENSTSHYMGVPVGADAAAENINALPLRAYTRIYDEWYRDQNLIDKFNSGAGHATDDGPDSGTDSSRTLLKSAKKHDYFTSALPYLQKGTAQVAGFTGRIAIATDAVDNEDVGVYQSGDGGWRKMDIGTGTHLEMDGTAALEYLYADLDLALPGQEVGGISINALREAAAVQRMLERDARAGTRPNELIRAHFGVTVPDFRVDRPEYLGGGSGYINATPIPQTTAIDSVNDPGGEDRYPGQLSGTAAGTLQASFAKSFVEHGWVIGILRARGAVTYSQGLDRKWSRQTRYDYLWPELAQLGEQPIYNKELWLQGDATDDNVFGYTERYADYRFAKSLITGQFDPAHSLSLDLWHLSEEFASQPSLNQTFIEDATPMERIQVVTTQHDFIMDSRFDLKIARVLPVKAQPSLMPARF